MKGLWYSHSSRGWCPGFSTNFQEGQVVLQEDRLVANKQFEQVSRFDEFNTGLDAPPLPFL